METKVRIEKPEKEFDTVKTFRTIKEQISKEIWGLSHEELMAYFERKKLKTNETTNSEMA
jgi:predicted membrane-bound dolichyl-phosphate-mannose-protein mannosyltransferase